MRIGRKELKDQLDRDEAFVEKLSVNVKNALAGEIRSFWPKAQNMWLAEPDPPLASDK